MTPFELVLWRGEKHTETNRSTEGWKTLDHFHAQADF